MGMSDERSPRLGKQGRVMEKQILSGNSLSVIDMKTTLLKILLVEF